MTDSLGQSQVLPYLVGLSKEGYQFHILSLEKMDLYKKHRAHISSICKENNIIWHPQDYISSKGILKKLSSIRRLKRIAEYLHKRHQFDLIHSRSYLPSLAAIYLKKKYGTPFIFDMRGFWVNERVDGGIWNLSSPIHRMMFHYLKKKEITFLKNADYTISLTENGKNEILSWKEIPNDTKIKIIPCCVDLDLFNPAKYVDLDKLELRKTLGIPKDAYVIGYVGSIGTWYMLSEMLDYFSELKKKTTNAIFLFVTKEPKEAILKVAREKGIPENAFVFTTSLHQDVPKYISLFDSSIFFIRPTYSKKASSPTKQGEIMAMGIPFVCNSGIGDTDKIVRKYRAGEVIEQFNPDVYKEHIINPENFDRQEIINGAHSYFSLKEGVKRYLEVYKAIYGD